jgi:hypothetical protein
MSSENPAHISATTSKKKTTAIAAACALFFCAGKQVAQSKRRM